MDISKAVREVAHEHITAAQQDGMKLGIRFSAKTLRDIADKLDEESAAAPDYIRGLRDAAVFIEGFAEQVSANG